MKDGRGKVVMTICGEDPDILIFINALAMHFKQETVTAAKVGNIVATCFTIEKKEPNCQLGRLEFQVLEPKSENYVQDAKCLKCGATKKQWQVDSKGHCGACARARMATQLKGTESCSKA